MIVAALSPTVLLLYRVLDDVASPQQARRGESVTGPPVRPGADQCAYNESLRRSF
jgi:hypothetical protein